MPYPFLSDGWLEEVQKLSAEAGADVLPASVRINLVVTGSPEGDRELHMADGGFGLGLLDDSRTKLTVPYAVAKAMFVNGDQQAAMQAFMSGQIKVEGDMSALMGMQAQSPGAGAADLQAKLRAMTSED